MPDGVQVMFWRTLAKTTKLTRKHTITIQMRATAPHKQPTDQMNTKSHPNARKCPKQQPNAPLAHKLTKMRAKTIHMLAMQTKRTRS